MVRQGPADRLTGDRVITTRSRTAPSAQSASPPARRSAFHIADVLLPISLALWAFGLSRTNATALGGYGLPANLPVVFYLGLALLVVSALIELARGRPTPWRMALHVVGLVVMLYGTAPILYPEGRYSWLYKTIGVVQYINQNGHLDRHIDIYQNWPGFFALAAWFGKVAGVSTPLAYAKWAQLVFELAALPLLYLSYAGLSLSVRQRWLALMVYAAGNWIAQDYYSPQALGTVLSLGIMAMIMRWLYGGNRDPFPRRRRFWRRKKAAARRTKQPPDQSALVPRVEVYEAYRIVRSYKGPAGTDGMTVSDFERDLPRNLQQVWVRLRDGTYTPSPVRVVPPPGGRGRPLSVLTISDMVAQIVITRKLESQFRLKRDADRDRMVQPSRSAPGPWKVEVDARSVFTACRQDLLLRVVEATTDQEWLLEYVSRCLRAPARQPDGSLSTRRLGTMPGSPLSAVLADLFLYYTLDLWVKHTFPETMVVRELDSAVVHCRSEREAQSVRAAIWQRLDDVALRLDKADIRVERGQYGEQTEVFALPALGTVTKRAPAAGPEVAPGRPAPGDRRPRPARATASARSSIIVCGTLMLLFFVLSFTHELSPYIVIVQLGVLAGGRLLRPRWLPLAFAAIAVGYLLPRFSYVSSTYGLLSSIGNFFSNVAPPSVAGGTSTFVIPASQIFIQRSAEVLSLLVWLLAVIGAFRRRRSGRTVLTLFALTFSPALVLAAQAYGDEGLLRVYLFSLPWAAALAASALEPLSNTASLSVSRLRGATGGFIRRKAPVSWIVAPLGLGLVLVLFFPAFFGDDASNVMTQSEVTVIYNFLQRAPLGPVYLAAGNTPVEDTARYNLFQLPTVLGTAGEAPLVNNATSNLASIIAQDSLQYTKNQEPAYVLISPSMIAYSEAYGGPSASSFTILLDSLKHSPKWKLLAQEDGTAIYELPAGQG